MASSDKDFRTVGGLTFEVVAPKNTTTTTAKPAGVAKKKKATGNVLERRRKIVLPFGFSQLAWMRKSATIKPPRIRKIYQEELLQHSSEDNMWMVLRGYVYDVTHYIPFHPGGVEDLVRGAGGDGTSLFEEVHPWVNFAAMLKNFKIGIFVPPKSKDKPTTNKMDIFEWRPSLVLHERKQISDTVYKLRFTLPSADTYPFHTDKETAFASGYGHHIQVKKTMRNADGSDRVVLRAFTPISLPSQPGFVDFLIKVYESPGGWMSNYLCKKLKIGRPIDVRGPRGTFIYKQGQIYLPRGVMMVRHFCFICGGSGITPVLQVLRGREMEQSSTPEIDVTTTVIYSSRTWSDTIAGPQLHKLAQAGRIRLVLALTGEDKSNDEIATGGLVTVLRERLSPSSLTTKLPNASTPGVFACVCGPPQFSLMVRTTLKNLEFKDTQVHQF